MANRAYIPSRYSTNDVLSIAEKLRNAGVEILEVRISESALEFAGSLLPGDCVVVHSFGVFESMVELAASLRLFFNAGASVLSLREGAMSKNLTPVIVEKLHADGVNSIFGRGGDLLVDVAPEKLSKLSRVSHLMQNRGLPMMDACRRAECTVNMYRYYMRLAESHTEHAVIKRSIKVEKNIELWPSLF